MIPQRICVTVEASTKVRFIASISTTHTIQDTLPLLLSKYQEVVRENMRAEQYNIEQFKANSIKQITKNGCLIPLKEYVSDVIVNGDQLFINLQIRKEKVQLTTHEVQQKLQSKKERLEKKKEQKQIAEHKKEKSEIREQSRKEQKKQQPIIQKKIQQNFTAVKDVIESKIKNKGENANKQEKAVTQRVKIFEIESKELASKLLQKMRLGSDKMVSKPVQKKRKVVIVQQQSSSSN